jgi:hypothetical protein
MPEIKTITWRQLTGNRFNKSLDSAMLSDSGSISTARIRRVGGEAPDIYTVVYDKEYATEFICRKFIRPLSFLGKDKVIQIVNEAWNLYEKQTLEPHFVSDSTD